MSLDTKRQVPELSLLSFVNGTDADQVRFVDSLYRGMKDYGFIILKDHIVDDKIVEKAYDLSHELFSLPLKTKESYSDSGKGGQRGYTGFGMEHAKDNPNPDLKEFWHVGREIADDHPMRPHLAPNIWPNEIKEFKETMLTLYRSMDVTSKIILKALGKSLDLPATYFDEMVEGGNSILRLIHYPAVDLKKFPNSVRAAAHEDINLITILVGATDGGLELLERDGSWLPVKTSKGQLIVDTGDMFSRITNEVIPATTHRVVNNGNNSRSRYSMPFFVHPHPQAELSCIPSCIGEGAKYPPINSNEFLMQRLKEIGLYGNRPS